MKQSCREGAGERFRSGLQDGEQFFEFPAQFADSLLPRVFVVFRTIAGQLLSRTTDGKTLLVQQAADVADHLHIVALIIAASAAEIPAPSTAGHAV